ncbi:TPA: hypothetical protein DEP21_01510 [Patescibacteria group bacterium]|nr:hypothetical protein [Candidatus Gracilibacteria bacterium]
MKANGGRGWIVAPLAVFFGANAWKGDSPLSLLNGGALTEAISGIFGGINRNTASPDQLAYTE